MKRRTVLGIMTILIIFTGLIAVLNTTVFAETDTTTEVVYPSDDSWVDKAERARL